MDHIYESQAEPHHKCVLCRKCRCIMREICFLQCVTSVMHIYNGTNNGNCYDEIAASRLSSFLGFKGGH